MIASRIHFVSLLLCLSAAHIGIADEPAAPPTADGTAPQKVAAELNPVVSPDDPNASLGVTFSACGSPDAKWLIAFGSQIGVMAFDMSSGGEPIFDLPRLVEKKSVRDVDVSQCFASVGGRPDRIESSVSGGLQAPVEAKKQTHSSRRCTRASRYSQ